ncbi:MAG: hypothetical protein ACPGLV_04215 [Bacteroidia bacterium]
MRHLLYILLLFPLALTAQVGELKFSSEFEKNAFYNVQSNNDLKSTFSLFFAISHSASQNEFEKVYQQLLDFNAEKKLHKHPRRLFDETQNEFFRVYNAKTPINQLIFDSTYNCVTGTALMAFFLELNKMKYQIEEQPYHVFLTANTKNRSFILETTDTEFGFLPNIKSNRRLYNPDTIDNSRIFKEIGDYSHLHNGQIVVKGQITLQELAGLNYYNTAIAHINQNNYLNAVNQLQKAYFLYPSKRIKEATKYCIIKVLSDDDVPLKQKTEYHKLLLNLSYSYSFQN